MTEHDRDDTIIAGEIQSFHGCMNEEIAPRTVPLCSKSLQVTVESANTQHTQRPLLLDHSIRI